MTLYAFRTELRRQRRERRPLLSALGQDRRARTRQKPDPVSYVVVAVFLAILAGIATGFID